MLVTQWCVYEWFVRIRVCMCVCVVPTLLQRLETGVTNTMGLRE